MAWNERVAQGKKVETDVMDVELKKKVEKVVKVAGKVGKAQNGETKHNAKQKMKLQCVAWLEEEEETSNLIIFKFCAFDVSAGKPKKCVEKEKENKCWKRKGEKKLFA